MVTTEHPQAREAGLAELCEAWCAAEPCGEDPRLMPAVVAAWLRRGPAWPAMQGGEGLCQSNYPALGPG